MILLSYVSCVMSGLYVLRWENPQPGDPLRYCDEIAQASRRQKQALVGLFIMPESSGVPDDKFKTEQAALLPSIMDHLDFAVAVFEGSGFAASLKRSALVAILLLSGQRQRVYVRSTVEDALLRDPPRPLAFDPYKALHELRERQLYRTPPRSQR